MTPDQIVQMITGTQVPTPGAGQSSDGLAALLGSIQGGEPHTTPMPATTFPEAPRAVNPEMTQMLMQMMMGAQQAPQLPSLGALLGGRV